MQHPHIELIAKAIAAKHKACADLRMKKPIPDRPEIGAQITSFNFASTLIAGGSSRGVAIFAARPILRGGFCGWLWP